MPVVFVWIVFVRVGHRIVPMTVRMPDRSWVTEGMVIVVDVVFMLVLMLQGQVPMGVHMPLDDVQPNSKPHQSTGNEECRGHGLVKNQYSQDGAEERRDREIRAGARGTQVPQCDHKQRQADAVGQEAQNGRPGQHAH